MSAELEYGLVGDFMTGRPARLLELVAERGLKGEHFTDNTARLAFERILALKSVDTELIRAELASLVGIPSVERALAASSLGVDGDEVTAYARRIEKIAKDGKIRELQAKLADIHKLAANPQTSVESFAAESMRILAPYAKATRGPSVVRPVKLSDLGPQVAESENPLALFENGWLRKGHAAFLVSTAGSGKSVITMQFCYAWALGREMFGIRPFKPLRIAVFQTEDDDDELRFFRDAMSYGYTHNLGWSDADVEKAVRNIDFFPVLGKMGDDFVEYLRSVQAHYNYDLVIINPFQGVTDFDISDNTAVRAFTRQKLDPIIKDPTTPCGLFVIHHTNKMQSDTARRPVGGKDVFAQYAGAGASEINNWMRAGFVILPYFKDGLSCYQLVAAKRGGRLSRWTKRPGFASPTKFIAHSEDEARYPFWTEVSPADDDKTSEEKKANVERLRAETLENDVSHLVAKITTPMTATLIREQARLLFGKKRGDVVYREFAENSAKHGIIQHKGVNNNSKQFGTPEMFRDN